MMIRIILDGELHLTTDDSISRLLKSGRVEERKSDGLGRPEALDIYTSA